MVGIVSKKEEERRKTILPFGPKAKIHGLSRKSLIHWEPRRKKDMSGGCLQNECL